MPKVSVIIPVYNREKLIVSAIESMLEQTYKDFELIVVDDGSTDNTFEVISRYERDEKPAVRIVHHSHNQGVSAAKNSGLAISTGEYIIFSGSDDIQHPERIERSVSFLEENPKVDMVFVDCDMLDEKKNPLHRRKGYPTGMNSQNAILYQLKRNHLFSGLVTLRRTEDIWFDTTLPNAVDYELFLRLLLKGYTFAIIDQVFVSCILNQNNISANGQISKKSVQAILSRMNLKELYDDLIQKHSEEEVRVAVAAAAMGADLPMKAIEYVKGINFSIPELKLEGAFISGTSFYQLKKFEEGLLIFQDIYRSFSSNPAVLNNLAVFLTIVTKQVEIPMDYLRKALVLRPGYLDAMHNLECLINGNLEHVRITERPLRESFIHVENYKL